MRLGKAAPALPPGWAAWDALMDEALAEARLAGAAGEVPVGAIIVAANGEIIGRGHNAPIGRSDPTAHAEIAAIRQACAAMGNYRLLDATLVVTLEPCLMCVGAAVHARLAAIVYGAADPKSGALDSCLQAGDLTFLNHRPSRLGGVLAGASAELLSNFFRQKREAAQERKKAAQEKKEAARAALRCSRADSSG